MTDLPRVLAERSVILDGGFSTQLERRGFTLRDSLWTARLLLTDPDAVRAAHADFFAAGAEVAITASYQVSESGFVAAGRPAGEASLALVRSVELAREAAAQFEGPRWVAASIGPYGATLADGSEYTGSYALDERALRDWHRPRIEALASAGPDVFAIETIPSAVEAWAIVDACADVGVPAWLSLTVADGRTRRGEPIAEVYAAAAASGVVFAVGANCCDPSEVDAVVEAARPTGLPVVFYPNSGELWDAQARCWHGEPTVGRLGAGWIAKGVRLLGGCCRVDADQIGRLAG